MPEKRLGILDRIVVRKHCLFLVWRRPLQRRHRFFEPRAAGGFSLYRGVVLAVGRRNGKRPPWRSAIGAALLMGVPRQGRSGLHRLLDTGSRNRLPALTRKTQR